MENYSKNEAKEELWAVYAWWACILVLKMYTLIWFTGRIRVKTQVIHSEEDRVWMKGPDIILCPTGGGHKDVDRIRSAHRRDLETVLPYLLITPMWLYTSPSFLVARTILSCFAILSISYTLLHMEIVKLHRYCKVTLFALQTSILFYITAITLIGFAYLETSN